MSLTNIVAFGQIRPGRIQGGENVSRRVPFFKDLLQTGRLLQQTERIEWYKSMLEEVLLFWFRSQAYTRFDIVILPYFNAISIALYAVKCLIDIHVFLISICSSGRVLL